ncbi:MAG: DUF2314 domain-containing protein [Bacteroidia bacterium]|nr:DUF2314 domain-containing protein [Bacteroidia bacterium]
MKILGKSLSILILVSFLLCSCEDNNTNPVNIQKDFFEGFFSIHLLPGEQPYNLDSVKAIFDSKLEGFEWVDSLSIDTVLNEIVLMEFKDPLNEFPPFDSASLSYYGRGLTEDEVNHLQNSSSAIVVSLTGRASQVIEKNIFINEAIQELLNSRKGIVTDLLTAEAFSKLSWRARRLDRFSMENQDISTQITTHSYREGQYCRIVSLGMEKFALPDISANQMTCSDQSSFVFLVNGIAQRIFEDPVVRDDNSFELDLTEIRDDSARFKQIMACVDGAKMKGKIMFEEVEPQEGDPYNVQYKLKFDYKKTSSNQEGQQFLIGKLYGFDDNVIEVNRNEAIQEASERARAELPRLQKLFQDSLNVGNSILLKAPFTTDIGGKEWMWVEVIEWNGYTIKGILQNDPYGINDLKAGATVTIRQRDVFDYILYKNDGSAEGNETGKLIEELNQ